MKFITKLILLGLLSLNVMAQENTVNSAFTGSFKGVKPAAIIDVRTPEEFALKHIDGAINIPVDQIASQILLIKTLKKDSPILLYCRSGARSSKARLMLEQQGYKNVLDGGGMEPLIKNSRAQ